MSFTIDKMKENGFKLRKATSGKYPSQSISDTDYADDIALLANTSAQAKFLLHSLERAAAGIILYVNGDNAEYMGYNQKGRHIHTKR